MTNENSGNSTCEARHLLFHGGIMTLLSLLSGFTTFFALAPRIALSSHTVGLLQGAILIAVAGSWQDLTVTVLGFLSVLILVSAILIIWAAQNKKKE